MSQSIDVWSWQLIAVVDMAFSAITPLQWIERGYFWQVILLTMTVGLGNQTVNYNVIWASLGVYFFSVIINGLVVIWYALVPEKQV